VGADVLAAVVAELLLVLGPLQKAAAAPVRLQAAAAADVLAAEGTAVRRRSASGQMQLTVMMTTKICRKCL
jgi:hypothetical protein